MANEEKSEKQPKQTIIELSDGLAVRIHEIKGKHIRKAQMACGKDTSMYIPWLIHFATSTTGGGHIMVEDMDEMNGGDYMKLMTAVTEQLGLEDDKTGN